MFKRSSFSVLRPPLALLKICALALLGWACNAHPVTPVDANLSAVDRIENRLPAKTKLDFLFVIDDSGSMCQEQERLARDFEQFSSFLFDELQGAADYRIAVISTDIGVAQGPTNLGHDAGAFLYAPAREAQSCDGAPMAFIPNTSDCEPSADPVISSSSIESLVDAEALSTEERSALLKAELERQFRCRATLGTRGGSIEKGLEAMRQSLSCRGPNSELFRACCVNPETEEAFYNPACTPEPNDEPQFLRPDATLVVLIISDEDDCSTPADAPLDTSRIICRQGGLNDGDADGVPDLYQTLCADPQDCYMRECGPYLQEGPEACYQERCEINENKCPWRSSRLSSIREYKEFLQGLKARPFDQLFVAPIVGFRTYTETGNLHRYVEAPAPAPECDNVNSPLYGTEACCPNGVCQSTMTFDTIKSCHLPDQNVQAYSGARYLELAESLGSNALGCPQGQEPSFDPVSGRFNESPECVSLCSESLSAPLRAIKDRVASLVNTYCLERSPPCLVQTEEGETRRCEGEEQLDPAHYSVSVSVSCEGERCGGALGNRSLGEDEWQLVINNTGCPTEVVLNQLPPAGSEVIIEFISDVEALIEGI